MIKNKNIRLFKLSEFKYMCENQFVARKQEKNDNYHKKSSIILIIYYFCRRKKYQRPYPKIMKTKLPIKNLLARAGDDAARKKKRQKE